MQNNDLKKYLESQNFVPSKKMGQNFLINKNTQLKLICLLYTSDAADEEFAV